MASAKPSIESNEDVTKNAVLEKEADKTCVVCFKIVDIFSIGECDHPVCYECSTRMRVLCKQNECPICRRINQRVIFTSEILPYRELEQTNRSGIYDRRYRICFTGQRAQNAFHRLLEHRCTKCNKETFESAIALKDHLRKEHELFYCDICMEHLKIFSFERRAYTREQLAQHRRKGDPDNKSHRGHPACEFCDQRYLDRDELFKHMRKEHFWCHFCDADGSNQYYADHTTLRDHFMEQHYLCEEGDCKSDIFSASFRSEIDLKAHKATVHGQTSKQARTIDFQFNLAPRNRSNREEQGTSSSNDPSSLTATSATRRVIDARNEQEFPSLGNAPVTIRPIVAMNNRPIGTSGLARTKENFPALGKTSEPDRTNAPSVVGNASALLFKSQTSTKSTTKSNNNNSSKATTKSSQVPSKSSADFPALPGGSSLSKTKPRTDFESDFIPSNATFNMTALPSKHRGLVDAYESVGTGQQKSAQRGSSSSKTKTRADLESDFIPSNATFNMTAVPSKHRSLVDAYESVGTGQQFNEKLKTVQRVEIKSQPTASAAVPKISSSKNFPALGNGSTAPLSAEWLTTSKKQPQQSRKSKVAPAPLLPTNGTMNESSKKKEKVTEKKEKPEKKTAKVAKTKEETNNESVTKSENDSKTGKNKTKKAEGKENSKQTKEQIDLAKLENGLNGQVDEKKRVNQNGSVNSYSSVANYTAPPPGFATKAVKVPPGFEPIANNSKRTFSYISPSKALLRNQILVSHFTKSLKAPAVEEFRNVSKLFRQGSCNARAYYEHCQVVLGDRFENIFPELLVLLPDIGKQQELLAVYQQKHDQSNSNLHNYIHVCDLCRQVLSKSDFPEHWQSHLDNERDDKLNKNFPKLSTAKK